MSRAPGLELDAYFDRIGYEGPTEPSVDALRALHLAHPLSIPFENLDVLLGRAPSLELPALQTKLVDEGRGGYCFEHNTLFRAVLQALGFPVVSLAARVRWMAAPDQITPRTHMALFVEAEDEAWLCDVGFGVAVMTAPLRLNTDEPQTTPHGVFRVTPRGHDLLVEMQTPLDERLPMYLLSLDPQADIDIELANWFVATHPDSPFRKNLMVAKVTAEARLDLMNRELTTRDRLGGVERRSLEPGEVAGLLSSQFDLPFAWTPDLQPVFADLPGPS